MSILLDESGVDIAEFCWQDADARNDEDKHDWLFRCWTYQYFWYRCGEKRQIDQCARAIGKALFVDTPVPTPTGWTTMGQLKPDDVIYGSDGQPVKVLAAYDVMNGRPCYNVRFDDGSVIIADEDHLWTTWDKRARRSGKDRRLPRGPEARTTKEIAATLSVGKEFNHSIPLAGALQHPDTDVPLDPYYLGAWLGDGTSRNAHITTMDEEILEEIRAAGYVTAALSQGSTGLARSYSVHYPEPHNHKTASVTAQLRLLGVLQNKHIPQLYKKSSESQRRALLAGLMDTDGHITPKQGHCEITLTNEELAFDAYELVISLNEKATITRRDATLNGVKICDSWRISWQPLQNCFRLPRKAGRFRPWTAPSRAQRRIVAVTQTGSVPVRCITVDAHDSLFLVGEAMIPTHNSVGIQMRAFAFPFTNAQQEMLISAPELIHLDPVTKYIEDRLLSVRLSREMLKKSGQSNGINKRPFEAKFTNGSKIIGRIPQKDGKGVKGMHPRKLEIDEGQDYPEPGWIELMETLRFGDENATWRIHGVSRGVRDRYYKLCQPESGYFTHKITAMHRPDWTPEERKAKAEYYGSRNHPDYRRNILGLHGDALSPMFVLSHLMQCHEWSTPINTPKGEQPIGSLAVGDAVYTASGVGVVSQYSESMVNEICELKLSNGELIYVTREHPYLTERGWVRCEDLEPGDRLITHEEAMRLVWGADSPTQGGAFLQQAVRGELVVLHEPDTATTDEEEEALRMVWSSVLPPRQNDQVLLRGLFSEMAWTTANNDTNLKELRVVQGELRSSDAKDKVLLGELSSTLGEQRPRETQAAESPMSQSAAGRTVGCAVSVVAQSGELLATGILDFPVRPSRGDHLLLSRPGPATSQDMCGGRRPESPGPDEAGRRPATTGLAGTIRVDCVAVLRPGDLEFDRRSHGKDRGDGRIKVVDVSVTGHPSFVVGSARVVAHNCISPESSDFTQNIYYSVSISDERLRDSGLDIRQLINLPGRHLAGKYTRFWVGADIGMTNHPTEILVFGEEHLSKQGGGDGPSMRLALISRINLQRISAAEQRIVFRHLFDHYQPMGAFSMDRTGLGLPIYQDIVTEGGGLDKVIRGYNFSEKIVVGWDKGGRPEEPEWDFEPYDPEDNAIMANVLEYSTDQLRKLVDQQRIWMPWDTEIIKEFQGQTYMLVKSNTNPYGKKEFNKGTFHALDAARMAVLGWSQSFIEPLLNRDNNSEVIELRWLDENDFVPQGFDLF